MNQDFELKLNYGPLWGHSMVRNKSFKGSFKKFELDTWPRGIGEDEQVPVYTCTTKGGAQHQNYTQNRLQCPSRIKRLSVIEARSIDKVNYKIHRLTEKRT